VRPSRRYQAQATIYANDDYNNTFIDWWNATWKVAAGNAAKIASKSRIQYALELTPDGCLVAWIGSRNLSSCDYGVTIPGFGWNLVDMTFSKGNLSLWLNGTRIANRTLDITSIPGGGQRLAVGYGLNATLEELMMYNAALSEVEIYDDRVKGLK